MKKHKNFSQTFTVAAATFALLAQASAPALAASLTILHNNDGETKLLPLSISGQTYAGASRFVTAVNTVRNDRIAAGRDVLTISSGDNFLASPIFTNNLSTGTFFDAQVISAINYDVITLGNHDFDFGPNVLAQVISQTTTGTYLSANLDFSAESSLSALVGAGKLAKSTVIDRNGEKYGIVGATTTLLSNISSPGQNVGINPVVAAVQAEIDALEAAGVNKIVFTSHLQAVNEDIATLAQLRGVDIAIVGGADPLLTNNIAPPSRDVFGLTPVGPYALTQWNGANGYSGPAIVGLDGNAIPVVSTAGEYRYLGVLDVDFDANGRVTNILNTSGPIVVDNSFAPDANIEANVIAPSQAIIDGLAANIIATSSVDLDGRRSSVRTRQTNQGTLVADALRWQAQQLDAADDSVLNDQNPLVGLQNGGGLRRDSVLAAGDINELNTFEITPFDNFLAVVKDVSVTELKAILENAVSRVEFVDGRFAQISGITFEYDRNRAAGDRVLRIELEDGTVLFDSGFVIADIKVDIATINFLANGQDGYPFPALGLGFDALGITYQQALFNYITQGLDGVIGGDRYSQAFADGLIVQTPEPGSLAILGLGGLALFVSRKRRKAA